MQLKTNFHHSNLVLFLPKSMEKNWIATRLKLVPHYFCFLYHGQQGTDCVKFKFYKKIHIFTVVLFLFEN